MSSQIPDTSNPITVPDLVRNYANKRFSCGLSEVIEFRFKNTPRAQTIGFFCRICHEDLSFYNVTLHCSSLIHLYRYTKVTFPMEYIRMTSNNILDKTTFLIRDIFLNKMKAFKALPKDVPRIIEVANNEEYLKALKETKHNFPKVELPGINIHLIQEKNVMEENDAIYAMAEALPDRGDKPKRSTFLQQLIGDDIDDC